MADFHQNGTIATLHNLTDRPVEELEERLVHYAKKRPMTLVLPSLFSELEGGALKNIVQELKDVPYLKKIVIGLDQADEKQFEYAKEFFSVLPQDHVILWNDGPRLRGIDAQLSKHSLSPPQPGKGRNVWYCLGYIMAANDGTKVVGLHDCDILTYGRTMLARLMYPVANPNFSYVLSKGYYPRVADDKMNGRVVRLLVTPFLNSLMKVYGFDPYINYLRGFRYPLSGEFAMDIDVLPDLRIPSDWGLEIGILSEIRRNYANKMVCQVDLADNYDHKHQIISEDDKTQGLSRMSIDIILSIFRKLATNGTTISRPQIRALKATYLRHAFDMIEMYKDDATMNGLDYSVHDEERTVELFAKNIIEAGERYTEDPQDNSAFVPRWNRVNNALPDIMDQMKDAIELDNDKSF